MPVRIDFTLTPERLRPAVERVFELSGAKILSLARTWPPERGTPVFTVRGRYTARGWTEWTQGFQFGSALLQFDATGEERFLELGRSQTLRYMATHVSHVGVHDHGFNNLSTYGNLWRLHREGRLPPSPHEEALYELALKVSGAVQAARWTPLAGDEGYIYSFNGPHSLFIDTVRSLRSLALAHQLGHVLMGEQDRRVSLLRRLAAHLRATATYNIYYGEGRDRYDTRGRVAHEAIFNTRDGSFRCPNSQQGYSPFSTWTRGLAWAICGLAEQLEYLATVSDPELESSGIARSAFSPPLGASVPARNPKGGSGGVGAFRALMRRAASATADYYLRVACADGIPPWDTGAPGLSALGEDYAERPADPYNAHEPVDSSAAAIAAQGLWRLGHYLGRGEAARRYRQAALTIARTLFAEPYLATQPKHQGLLLHSVYHRPNGWDYVAPGQSVPNGESSQWGDYHARELALLIWRAARGLPYYCFHAPARRESPSSD